MYKIQGSYLVFLTKNDSFGLGGPLVWTKTLSRDKWEGKQAESWGNINKNSSLSQYAPLYFQELFYLLRKMSHCDVLSQYFNYGLTWGDMLHAVVNIYIYIFFLFEYFCP